MSATDRSRLYPRVQIRLRFDTETRQTYVVSEVLVPIGDCLPDRLPADYAVSKTDEGDCLICSEMSVLRPVVSRTANKTFVEDFNRLAGALEARQLRTARYLLGEIDANEVVWDTSDRTVS